MRITACYKCVPNDQEITVKGDRTLDISKAQYVLSRYDLEAVEAAMQLKGEEDQIFALTVAGDVVDNTKLRKAILSRGPQELYAVHDEQAQLSDSLRTAAILKSAVEKIGDVDLVLCGEGSEDMYCQQVGPALGTLLGWTTVNAVSSIKRSDNGLIVERSLENSTEVLEISLPAVISVCAGMITPRIPSMKDILAAGKKPVSRWEAADLGESANSTDVISVLAPEMADRRCEIIKGSGEDEIEAFYQLLRKAL